MANYKRTLTLRRLGVGEVIPLYKGHPWTVDIDNDSGLWDTGIYYTQEGTGKAGDGVNARRVTSHEVSSWRKLVGSGTGDRTAVAVPAAATHLMAIVTATTDVSAGRRGAKVTLTTQQIDGLHGGEDYASGASRIPVSDGIPTPSFMMDSTIVYKAEHGHMFSSIGGAGNLIKDGENAQSTRNQGRGGSLLPFGQFPTGGQPYNGFGSTRSPVLVVDGLGGYPELHGNGTDTLCNNNMGSPALDNFTNITMFWIGRKLRAADDYIMGINNSGQAGDGIYMGYRADGNFRFARNDNTFNDVAGAPAIAAGWAIMGVDAAGALQYADVSFIAAAVGLTGTEVVNVSGTSGFTDMFTQNAFPSDALCTISEAYITDRLWTTQEQIDAKAYANAKFGLVPL